MKRLLSILFLLFTLPVFAQNTILVLGDSLSAGFGVTPQKEWPVLLQTRLNDEKYDYKVINESMSGETLTWGLGHLPGAIFKYKPNIIIIELGANDGLGKLPLSSIKENLQNLIKMAKKSNSKILLLGIDLSPFADNVVYRESFQRIFSGVAKQQHIIFVPDFLKDLDGHPTLKQPDGLHPTTEAQSILLDNVWPDLKKLLNK